jgi:hypothetical protein
MTLASPTGRKRRPLNRGARLISFQTWTLRHSARFAVPTHHVPVTVANDPVIPGPISPSNVGRAMVHLGVLDEFLDAAIGFDAVDIFIPDGTKLARVPSPSLVEGKPANVGIGRRELQKVLADSAKGLGTEIRLGLTVESFNDDSAGVETHRHAAGKEAVVTDLRPLSRLLRVRC